MQCAVLTRSVATRVRGAMPTNALDESNGSQAGRTACKLLRNPIAEHATGALREAQGGSIG